MVSRSPIATLDAGPGPRTGRGARVFRGRASWVTRPSLTPSSRDAAVRASSCALRVVRPCRQGAMPSQGSAGREFARLQAAVWASIRSGGQRPSAAVSAREAATDQGVGPPGRGPAAAGPRQPGSRSVAHRGLRPQREVRRRAAGRTCSASAPPRRQRRRIRREACASARSSSVTVSSAVRWPASWMSSSSSRERWGTSAGRRPCCGPTWCGSVRTWDGLLECLHGIHPNLDFV